MRKAYERSNTSQDYRPVKTAVESYYSQKSRKKGKILISIVIPCYNEEKLLREAVAALISKLPDNELHSYEFIFIDDGSLDRTPEILLKACESDERVKAIRLISNFGSHVACRAGLEYCSGDVAVFLTADFQEGADLVSLVVEKWREGAGVVCSVAESRRRGSLASNAFAHLYYFLIRRSPGLQYLEDIHALPRLIDRENDRPLLPIRAEESQPFRLDSSTKISDLVCYYKPPPREQGVSKWTLKKRFVLAWNTLLDITPWFLTVWALLGLILIGLGLIGSLWIILRGELTQGARALQESSRGVLVVAAVWLSFIGGMILLGSGMLGSYLWRIYDDLRQGPEFAVEWTTNFLKRDGEKPADR